MRGIHERHERPKQGVEPVFVDWVKDGQTLVLGGIYVVQKGQRQSRVPYLHAIPLFGALFRSIERDQERRGVL